MTNEEIEQVLINHDEGLKTHRLLIDILHSQVENLKARVDILMDLTEKITDKLTKQNDQST